MSADRWTHKAWEQSQCAESMLKFAAERGVDRVLLVRVACAIARTALHIMPDGEDKPRLAIDTKPRGFACCGASATRDG